MNWLSILVSSTNFNSLLLGIIGALLAYREWRSGVSKADTQAVGNYKSALDSANARMDEMMKTAADNKKEFEAKINDLNIQVGELNGKLHEKNNSLQTLTTILENRNPELTQVLESVVELLKRVNDKIDNVAHTTDAIAVQSTKTEAIQDKKY